MTIETPGAAGTKPVSMAFQGLGKHEALKTWRYEKTKGGQPPIPITIAPPRAPPADTHPALRGPARSLADEHSHKRDSGLAPTTSSTVRESSALTVPDAMLHLPQKSSSAVVAQEGSSTDMRGSKRITSSGEPNTERPATREHSPNTPEDITVHDSPLADTTFSPLTTAIPSNTQLELDFMENLTFSTRGSVLLGGRKAVDEQLDPHASIRSRAPSSTRVDANSKLLSPELEIESQKVRSMYEAESPLLWEHGSPSISAQLQRSISDTHLTEPVQMSAIRSMSATTLSPNGIYSRRGSTYSNSPRKDTELAGGVEDWEDISGEDVDRYGFITTKFEPKRSGTPEPRPPQRASTVLQIASDAPRKKRGFGRTLSSARSTRSAVTTQRTASRKVSTRSIRTQGTAVTRRSTSKSLRTARNRRWMDEAGDMLTLPPGLADIAEEQEGGRAAEVGKKKESNRTEKWRKMAKQIKGGTVGEGMVFQFDVNSSKLIERTWKGIPDCWRAAAWHSFLSASAKKVKGSPTDEEIIASFYEFIPQSSADDVQIDLDVPRTINSHIMFRKRYRGGQRLLFRVLHAISLYFPATGYVQGMASLAATLLCYYDEEKCFVMLARLWRLRGLEKLYAPGFGGLMAALDEFQKGWMNGHDVSQKLEEHNIDPTAYGTRWYLTLFNYSIPFPAQLRVWDVFMLLGDVDPAETTTPERPFAGSLDVLHAASCALIDGTREILLDSDFENSMKVLTSWIPIKDEELFMKVAKAEWKMNHGKKRP